MNRQAKTSSILPPSLLSFPPALLSSFLSFLITYPLLIFLHYPFSFPSLLFSPFLQLLLSSFPPFLIPYPLLLFLTIRFLFLPFLSLSNFQSSAPSLHSFIPFILLFFLLSVIQNLLLSIFLNSSSSTISLFVLFLFLFVLLLFFHFLWYPSLHLSRSPSLHLFGQDLRVSQYYTNTFRAAWFVYITKNISPPTFSSSLPSRNPHLPRRSPPSLESPLLPLLFPRLLSSTQAPNK